MSLEIDGNVAWETWRGVGMYVNGEGKFLRMERSTGEYIWYRTTETGFEGINEDSEIDVLEERYMNAIVNSLRQRTTPETGQAH